SISSARGAILSWAKPRVVSRSASTSAPRPKSKPCQAFGIMGALWPDRPALSACANHRLDARRRLALHQQQVQRLARTGMGEQIALHFLAAGEPQQHALLLGLDALE